MLWVVGDGVSRGDGLSDPATEAFPAQVARQLGWTSAFLLATGFGQTGAVSDQAAAARIHDASLPTPAPSLIVLELGRNDGGISASLEQHGVAAAVAAVRAKAGSTPLVILGPIVTSNEPYAGIRITNNEIASAASELGVPFVSPITEQWVSPENAAELVTTSTSGGTHFQAVGQRYLAGRFVADLSLLTSPS